MKSLSNNKYLTCLAICLLIPIVVLGQKKKVDADAFKSWPSLGTPGINSDGTFAYYQVDNDPIDKSTLHVVSLNSDWSKQYVSAANPQFSDDGKVLYFLNLKGDLIGVKLGKDSIRISEQVRQFDIFSKDGKNYIIYVDFLNSLCIRNLSDHSEQKYKNVTQYVLSPTKNNIIIYYHSPKPDSIESKLKVVVTANFSEKVIWEGDEANSFIFNETGTEMAFISVGSLPAKDKKIWRYNLEMEKILGVQDTSFYDNIDATYEIIPQADFKFSKDGDLLFFLVGKNNNLNVAKKKVAVDVWSYEDSRLRSEQFQLMNKSYLCGINLTNGKVEKFMSENDDLVVGLGHDKQTKLVIVENIVGNRTEYSWNHKSLQSTYFISTLTGARKPLKINAKYPLLRFSVSPASNFIVYYDPEVGSYFSYDVKDDISRNITKDIPANWTRFDCDDKLPIGIYPVGISGWLDDEQRLIVNGKYDLWLIDPKGGAKPINLTNFRGQNERTIFSICKSDESIFAYGRNILLKAFDTKTKDCGFYNLTIQRNSKGSLERLYMGPYLYDERYNDYSRLNVGSDIVRATNRSAFLVRRESATTFPNFYFTTDFKNFKNISKIQPEQQYNWYTTELVTIPLPKGDSTSGILYKPENFDSRKKYPLIIYFYEKFSNTLNKYYKPNFGGKVDFSHFLSDDYLIFVPDIKYDSSKAGESALITVEAAANALSNKEWVDSGKIGINGHSFGGYEVNYIVTHSNRFAAAIAGAGYSDMISAFGSVWGSGGFSNQSNVNYQYRVPGTPWTNAKDFLESSPIFFSNFVTTPILLFHNQGDQSVPFGQGLEFYTNLRRAGKKVWLLQYDSENHVNVDTDNSIDLEIRYKQFFDHFLKGKIKPEWMNFDEPTLLKSEN